MVECAQHRSEGDSNPGPTTQYKRLARGVDTPQLQYLNVSQFDVLWQQSLQRNHSGKINKIEFLKSNLKSRPHS